MERRCAATAFFVPCCLRAWAVLTPNLEEVREHWNIQSLKQVSHPPRACSSSGVPLLAGKKGETTEGSRRTAAAGKRRERRAEDAPATCTRDGLSTCFEQAPAKRTAQDSVGREKVGDARHSINRGGSLAASDFIGTSETENIELQFNALALLCWCFLPLSSGSKGRERGEVSLYPAEEANSFCPSVSCVAKAPARIAEQRQRWCGLFESGTAGFAMHCHNVAHDNCW